MSCDLDRLFKWKLLFLGKTIAQSSAWNVGHDVVEEALRLIGIIQRQDMRVGHLRGNSDLSQEAIDPEAASILSMKNF